MRQVILMIFALIAAPSIPLHAAESSPGSVCSVDEASRGANPVPFVGEEPALPARPPRVNVVLDDSGSVIDTAITRSSRNRIIDRTAQMAAQSWRYTCAVGAQPSARQLEMEIPVPLSRLSDTVADELAKAFGVEQVIAAAAAQSSPLIIDEVDRQVGRCLKDAREAVIRDFYRREMRTRFGDDAEGAAWLAYAETASGKEVVTNLQAGIGAAMTQSRLDANHVLASLAKVQLPDQADRVNSSPARHVPWQCRPWQ
jgi:TonB family protein